MLDDFGIDDRLGSLNVSLGSFHLCLRCQHVCRSRVYLRLAFITVALDLGQGLRALLTHAGLSFNYCRLYFGHFSGQAGQISVDIVVDRLRLRRGVRDGGVSVSLNAVQCVRGAFQACLSFSLCVAGELQRLVGVFAAGF